jgi:hypothetical protein
MAQVRRQCGVAVALTEGVLDVTAVEEPAPGSSKAATTPAMDRASISPPMINIQIGGLHFGGEASTGSRGVAGAVACTGSAVGAPTGWRLAVQARPFQ